MNNFIMAQFVGILVCISGIVAMQFKDMRWVLFAQIVSNLLSALNMALLGGFSGAGVCITAIVQTVVIFVLNLKNAKLPVELSIIFSAVYTACSVAAYRSVYDIIPCVAALTYAMSVIQTKSSVYRVYIFLNCILWATYDLFIGAYTAILTYVIMIVSIAVAFVRHDISEWKELFAGRKQ